MRIPEPAQGARSEVLFPDQRVGTAGSHLIVQLGQIVHGIQNDDRSRVLRAKPTGRLDPIHDRHADVQENELRFQLGRQRKCFLARGCLPRALREAVTNRRVRPSGGPGNTSRMLGVESNG